MNEIIDCEGRTSWADSPLHDKVDAFEKSKPSKIAKKSARELTDDQCRAVVDEIRGWLRDGGTLKATDVNGKILERDQGCIYTGITVMGRKVDAFERGEPSAIAGKWAKNLCDTIGIAIPGKAICDRWWYDQVVKGVQSAIDEAVDGVAEDTERLDWLERCQGRCGYGSSLYIGEGYFAHEITQGDKYWAAETLRDAIDQARHRGSTPEPEGER